MKKPFLILFVTTIMLFLFAPRCFPQDKQVDFTLGSNEYVYKIAQGGDDDFYIVYGKMLLSKNATKNLMKFDKDMKALWTAPVAFSGSNDISIMSYTNASDQKTTSYIIGGEQFLQVLSDGTTKEKKTEIPEKELENIGAVFVDSLGLNFITLTGDKDFTTGKMNWYTFPHSSLTMTKKSITLTQPAGTGDKNASNWRLCGITSKGIYFNYVFYKKNTDDTQSPILTCYLVNVDYSGKVGSTITLDMERDKYNIIPCDYSQEVSGMNVYSPGLFDVVSTTTQNGSYNSYLPLFNSFMGIAIDEKSNTIYTAVASNDELKVDGKGNPKTRSLGRSYLINNFTILTFDLAGKKLNESTLTYTPTELESNDECSYVANNIILCPLPNKEGLILQASNNNNGHIYACDNTGVVKEQNKISLFTYKMFMRKYSTDVYSYRYASLKDFEGSPYFLGTKSPVCTFFNKLDEKEKKAVSFLSLKSGYLLTKWDGKADVVKLNFFNKN